MSLAAAAAPQLNLEHLPLELRVRAARLAVRPQAAAPVAAQPSPLSGTSPGEPFSTFKEHRRAVVAAADKIYLRRLMERAQGSIKQACEIADLSRTRLYYLMQEHGVSKKES